MLFDYQNILIILRSLIKKTTILTTSCLHILIIKFNSPNIPISNDCSTCLDKHLFYNKNTVEEKTMGVTKKGQKSETSD